MSRVAKRVLDVGLSGFGVLISAPLWALIAAAIRLDTRGPVFYGQARVGEGGCIFRVLKFRSMIVDAEKDVGPIVATEGDMRVTRVGRVLRATAMDELPQLWNIFRRQSMLLDLRLIVLSFWITARGTWEAREKKF
jgi:lipopolysaccharide/colanic/teichoic acid biosynthesis glycosyltransferase